VACARESGVMSTFNFPFLFFGLGRSSVNHGSLFCLSCSVCASCCCPFSCCALVSLLLLCSRVPSPDVLCVHRPLLSLLSSHAPSSSARRRRTQLITPLPRALSGARHILIPAVPSTSLCVVSLDRSVAFPVQSLQRTELIRHIFLIRFLSFLSFFLFSSSSLAQSTKIWRGY